MFEEDENNTKGKPNVDEAIDIICSKSTHSEICMY